MILSLVVLISCESDTIDNNIETSSSEVSTAKRPIFKDWEEYYSAYRELNRLVDEQLILDNVSDKGYSSFLKQALISNDEETLKDADELSVSLMALMNEDKEFQIGDSIVRYSNNNFSKSLTATEDATVIDNIQVVTYNDEDGFSK